MTSIHFRFAGFGKGFIIIIAKICFFSLLLLSWPGNSFAAGFQQAPNRAGRLTLDVCLRADSDAPKSFEEKMFCTEVAVAPMLQNIDTAETIVCKPCKPCRGNTAPRCRECSFKCNEVPLGRFRLITADNRYMLEKDQMSANR